jgi:hypothetical protein
MYNATMSVNDFNDIGVPQMGKPEAVNIRLSLLAISMAHTTDFRKAVEAIVTKFHPKDLSSLSMPVLQNMIVTHVLGRAGLIFSKRNKIYNALTQKSSITICLPYKMFRAIRQTFIDYVKEEPVVADLVKIEVMSYIIHGETYDEARWSNATAGRY